MSSVNGDGKGNLLITYKFQAGNLPEQIKEESQLKAEIAQLLSNKGYKFVIADDEIIDQKLIGN